MRIGIFTDCYYPQINGVVRSVCMLEEELIKLGHEVTIITVAVPNYADDKKNIVRILSIPFTKCKEFRIGVPLYIEPYRTIKALQLDIIHTHTEFSIGLLGKHMAKLLRIPRVHTYHTMYEDYSRYVYNFKYGKNLVKKLIIKGSKQYIKKYDGVIAPTDKTRNALIGYGVKNDIFVVPTGIDLQQFDRINRDDDKVKEIMGSYGLTESDSIMLSLGRISEEKSIDLIIKQMPFLINSIKDLKLLIVGDGPYRNKLEKITKQLKLEDHVIFVGSISFNEVIHFYSMADLFVSASKTETQGLTIIEAMASGLPVVVYDDTNVKDIVIEGKSGRLFQNEGQLIIQIANAFSNKDQTVEMAVHAFEIVRRLSKEAYGKNAENVYAQLCFN